MNDGQRDDAALEIAASKYRRETTPLLEPVALGPWMRGASGLRVRVQVNSSSVVGFARSDAEEAAEDARLLARGYVLGGGATVVPN